MNYSDKIILFQESRLTKVSKSFLEPRKEKLPPWDLIHSQKWPPIIMLSDADSLNGELS